MLKPKPELTPKKEKEFNDWYNKIHLLDALKIPGYISGHRYKEREGKNYLTIYRIENEAIIPRALTSKEVAYAREEFVKKWAKYFDYTITVFTHIHSETRR